MIGRNAMRANDEFNVIGNCEFVCTNMANKIYILLYRILARFIFLLCRLACCAAAATTDGGDGDAAAVVAE